MDEFLGTLLILVLALYWIAIAGQRSGTTLQSSVAFVLFSTLNFGLFLRLDLVDDEATYFHYSAALANNLLIETTDVSSRFAQGKESYIWILALLMVLFGQSPLPGLALSVLLMVTLPAIFVWAGRNFGIFSSGSLTAWLVVVSPPILLWGHGLSREPLVFFLLGCLLLSFSWIVQGRWPAGFGGVAVVAIAMSSTRSSLLSVVAAGAVAFAVVRLLDVSRRAGISGWGLKKNSFAIFSLVPVALFVPAVTMGLAVVDSPSWKSFGVGIPELSDAGQATAVVGATWTYNSSLEGFSYNVVRSLIGPMPWEVSNMSLLIFAAEGMGYLLFLGLLLIGGISSERVRDVGVALGTAVLPMVVAASLLMANYGLNSRIRAHIFLLLLILVEPAVARLLRSWRELSLESGSRDLGFSWASLTWRNL